MTAPSGTYAFNPEIAEIVVEGFSRVGIPEDQIDTFKIRQARMSLNLLFTEWGNKGPNLWAVDLISLPLVQGAMSVALTAYPGTIALLDVYLTASNIADTIMSPMSRSQYASLANKAQQGTPTQYWLERLVAPVLHVWQTANSNLYTVKAYRMRQLQDVSAAAQGVDAPVRWMDAICAGLAARLARKYKPALVDSLKAEAKEARETAATEDRERVPMRVLPNLGAYRR